MGQWVDVMAADGAPVPAWIDRPAGAPRGGVVVAQEIFGVNRHIRDVARRVADAGYLAVAPALFTRVRPGVDLAYGAQDVQAGRALKAAAEALPAPGVLADVQAAIDTAAQQGAGRVGIVGFCWGGLLAWRAAAQCAGLSAAVSYYGGGMTAPPEVARTPRVPLLAHFGRRDAHISLEGVDALARAHPAAQVYLYEADHGFHCDQRASYNAPAAQQAWRRTLDFWAQHLG